MTRKLRFLIALCAALALAGGLAACGGIPGNSIAKVGGQLITFKQFKHWVGIVGSSQPQQTGGKPQAPDPPGFTHCIAAKRKALPKPPKGQKPPSDSSLKQECQTEYDTLKTRVESLLINAAWIDGEAKDQGVKVSDSEVRKQFEMAKKQAFPQQTEARFRAFLKSSGQTLPDLLVSFRTQALTKKIRDKVVKGTDKVSDKQIADYYSQHKASFGQPERRDLSIVLTKTQAKAQQALKAVRGGTQFAQVAKRFSTDQSTKTTGGKLLAVSKGQQDRSLDSAAFSSPKGKLGGPIKTQFGFYVFRVDKITPASQQSLAQSKASIRQLLASQNMQTTLEKFVMKYQKKWTARTDCRKGYIVMQCKNAPKPKPQPALPPGAAPQGGGPPPGAGGAQGGGPPPGAGGGQGGPPPGAGGAQGAPPAGQ